MRARTGVKLEVYCARKHILKPGEVGVNDSVEVANHNASMLDQEGEFE